MDRNLFWRALAVQGLGVGVLFAVLIALPLPEDFFDDWGLVTGPVAWIAVTFLSAAVLSLPRSFVLFCALAGGVAGAIVGFATEHTAGLVVALLVFAASCSGYEELTQERAPAES